MLKYLKEYRIEDMRAMLMNNRMPHHRSSASLRGKTAVISGATSGVGLAGATEMARHGCGLVLVARNEAKVRQVAATLAEQFEVPVRHYLADFADLEEVRRAAERIAGEVDRIDLLINSAGMHSTRRIHTAAGFELVFCVNHLAPFILTHRLIPRLKERAGSRIIQVSSQGHRFNGLDPGDLNWNRRIYTGLRGYGASKTAQLLTVWELADRLRGTGVSINAMHPGEVRSNIGGNNGRLYNWYKSRILWKSLKDVTLSGESLHYLAADPALEGVTGTYFNRTHPEKPAPHALDREVGRMIWEETLHMTGLPDEL